MGSDANIPYYMMPRCVDYVIVTAWLSFCDEGFGTSQSVREIECIHLVGR